MVTRDDKQLACDRKATCQGAKPGAKHKVSPLRQSMIRDMELAGLTRGTQQTYIGAVVKLQGHYHTRPDRLSEKQVQEYIFWLRDEKDVAKGTFQTSWYGLKSFYYRTLGVDWVYQGRESVAVATGHRITTVTSIGFVLYAKQSRREPDPLVEAGPNSPQCRDERPGTSLTQ